MARSLAAGRRVTLPHVGPVRRRRRGQAGRQGDVPPRARARRRDGAASTPTRSARRSRTSSRTRARSSSPPARSRSRASKAWVERHRTKDRTLVAIACGANMNFDRLRFVAERAELGEQREAVLAVTIPERPGSFREFCALLGKRTVTEFNYRYADARRRARLRRRRGREPAARPTSCSPSSSAAGSRRSTSPTTRWRSCTCATWSAATRPRRDNEILYRFEFPERPGALMHFLDSMSAGWNISLFHYRNHGADYGRVLVGHAGARRRDKAEFRRFPRRASATTTSTRPAIPPTGCSSGAEPRNCALSRSRRCARGSAGTATAR